MSSIAYTLSLLPRGTEPAEEHGQSGDVMSHILDHKLVELPTVLGIDLSITYHLLFLWISSALLLLILPTIFGKKKMVPKGFANAIESIVVFLREDVIYNYLGNEGKRFEPYILTVFFFILANNLMGLVPGCASATSDISVTATLTLITFSTLNIAGMQKNGLLGYWKGLVPSGIPIALVPLMFIIEIVALLAKHIALAMRLFANMTAGHITILSIIGLIFTFKSYVIAPLPVVGAAAISVLEILVAFIQAYIFTLLSAVYIGMAIHQEH